MATANDNPPEEKGKFLISRRLDGLFLELYRVNRFLLRIFRETVMPPYEFKEIVRQCYEVGVKSLPLIGMTGFITGVVFTKQSRPSLAEFGATSWLPNLISIAIIRALAPLVTALIAAGKVGSNIGAELGSMNVTEQIDAMEVSATNPFKFLVVTRVIATTIMIPILAIFTGFIGMMGGYMNIHTMEQTSFSTFLDGAFQTITFLDIFASLFKATVFGFTIGAVSCYKGYFSSKGTEGVGRAANAAVVTSMFLIFIEEILVVQVVAALR
jgi:phospholipid/cholesterol/gamma-HCH transport system permease protein